MLSEQLGRARIITPVDVKPDEITIGSIVEIVDSKGTKSTFTILGPWDADADNQILSSHSKFVQAMLGLSKNDHFSFRNEDYTILQLKTIFDGNKTCKG